MAALIGLHDASGEPLNASQVNVAKGEDLALEFRIRCGNGRGKPVTVTLTANALAGATSLSIKPDHPALSSGDKLLFGEDVVVTLSAGCAVGVTTLAVTATDCAFNQGDGLVKLQDLTAMTLKMEVLASRGDATPFIADTSFTVVLATQTGTDRGKVTVSCLAAVTAALTAGSYYGALWRRESGNTRPLAGFTFKLGESGFL